MKWSKEQQKLVSLHYYQVLWLFLLTIASLFYIGLKELAFYFEIYCFLRKLQLKILSRCMVHKCYSQLIAIKSISLFGLADRSSWMSSWKEFRQTSHAWFDSLKHTFRWPRMALPWESIKWKKFLIKTTYYMQGMKRAQTQGYPATWTHAAGSLTIKTNIHDNISACNTLITS